MRDFFTEKDIDMLVEKVEFLQHENDNLLDQLTQYREWFILNEEILKTIPVTYHPYGKEEEASILRVIHAKYCPHTILEE